MRTEQEMYDLILNFAKNDERIRSVYMNGSRANPNAPKDKYRDFDIVFVVRDFETFREDNNWIDIFGERLILQMPESMRDPSGRGSFTWMMLFTDGNRLDLTLIPITRLDLIENDSATVVLLDKDGILPEFPPASDKDYIVRPPDELYYYSCLNNFFWCMQNVAKGITRDELPYAMKMYNHYVREELNCMTSWYIGITTSFKVSSGKMGKYFKRYLPENLYGMYVKTYSDGNYENLWEAVFTACKLFRVLAQDVAQYFGYTYNSQDDDGIMRYLEMMREETLSADMSF